MTQSPAPAPGSQPGHFSSDAYPVTVGARFWSNDLRGVEIASVAEHSNVYADTGEVQTWHATFAGGSFDTLSGSLRPYGRLVRFFEGKDATAYPAGTEFADVR
jgi:hypothetical protein